MALRRALLVGLLCWSVCGRCSWAQNPYKFPEQLGLPTPSAPEPFRSPEPLPQQAPEQLRAPEQLPQPSYFPAGHSIYEQADVEEMLNYAPLREQREQQIGTTAESYQIQPVQYPFEVSGADDLPNEPPPLVPGDYTERGILWSKRLLQTTVLPGSGDQLGIFELDTRATFHFARAPMFRFTPQFALRTLNGPESTDLPGSLYDFSLTTMLYIPFNDEWRMMAEISPGIYSDFEAVNGDSLRLPSRVFGFYRWSPALDFAFGFVYFDRDTVGFLPAAGLVYTPSDELRVEVTFPRPKISYRYYNDGDRQRTVDFVGEFGGGSWTVRRASGADDSVTLNDLRLLLGWEHREGKCLHWSVEAGYVFNRKLEYRSHIGDQDLDSTALLRFSIGY